MKKVRLVLSFFIFGVCFVAGYSLEKPKSQNHLFILSGQSNMSAMNPDYSFVPAVEKEYGKDNTLVVKDAASGRAIRKWHKDYKFPKNHKKQSDSKIGALYDRLIKKVKEAMGDKKYDTVTFCWMQGESDAVGGLADSYEAAFKGIISQLKKDLEKENIYFVIGRINDCDMDNKRYKHWTKIRDIQVKLAEEDKNGQWINTDDLNDGVNKKGKSMEKDMHMTKEGYIVMGERFAEKSIALINGTVKEEK